MSFLLKTNRGTIRIVEINPALFRAGTPAKENYYMIVPVSLLFLISCSDPLHHAKLQTSLTNKLLKIIASKLSLLLICIFCFIIIKNMHTTFNVRYGTENLQEYDCSIKICCEAGL